MLSDSKLIRHLFYDNCFMTTILSLHQCLCYDNYLIVADFWYSWLIQLSNPAVLSSCLIQLSCPHVFSSHIIQLSYPAVLSNYLIQLYYLAILSSCLIQLLFLAVVSSCCIQLSYPAVLFSFLIQPSYSAVQPNAKHNIQFPYPASIKALITFLLTRLFH